jgi:hypothetical protein
MIALGTVLLALVATMIVVPVVVVGHVEADLSATPGERAGAIDVSELPPECRTIVRRLAAGENVSREYYEIRLGGTTHVVHYTNFSTRPVGPVSVHGGRLSDWQIGDDYCDRALRGEYRVDGEYYRVGGWRLSGGRIPFRWNEYETGLAFLAGTFLIAAGQSLRPVTDFDLFPKW